MISNDTEDLSHLIPFGYAPGWYIGKCSCGATLELVAKYTTTCRPCAEKLYAQWKQCQPAGENMMGDGI